MPGQLDDLNDIFDSDDGFTQGELPPTTRRSITHQESSFSDATRRQDSDLEPEHNNPKPDSRSENDNKKKASRSVSFTIKEDHYLLALIFNHDLYSTLTFGTTLCSRNFFGIVAPFHSEMVGFDRSPESLRSRFRRDLRAMMKSYLEDDTQNIQMKNYAYIFELYHNIVEKMSFEGHEVTQKQESQRRRKQTDSFISQDMVDGIIEQVQAVMTMKQSEDLTLPPNTRYQSQTNRIQNKSKINDENGDDTEFLAAEPRGKRKHIEEQQSEYTFDRYIKKSENRLQQFLDKSIPNTITFDAEDCLVVCDNPDSAGESLSGTYMIRKDEMVRLEGNDWMIRLPKITSCHSRDEIKKLGYITERKQ